MSIKINKIEINGVRGSKFSETCKNSININGKTLLLYGNNGDGKSTLYDSLEWALTDNIEELKNRQMKDWEKYNILKNKFCTENEVPYVYIDYIHNGNGQSIKRELRPRAEKFHVKNLDVCFIDLGRIERFVVDTRSSLWDRFSNLLGLEIFNDYITRLERLYNEVERRAERFDDDLKKIDEKIQEKENGLEKLKANNDINPININFVEIRITKVFEEKDELKEKINNYKNIRTLIDKIKEINNAIVKKENEIDKKEKDIKNLSEYLDIEVKEVIKTTRNFLNKTERKVDICPVCQRGGIIKSKLIEEIENTWEKYEDLDLCEEQVEGLIKTVKELKRKKESYMKDIKKGINRGYFTRIQVFNVENIDQYINEYISSNKSKDEKRLKELENICNNYEIIGKINKLSKNIEKIKEDYKKGKKTLEKYNQIQNDVSEIITVFSKKVDSSIQSSLENISKNDITYIYNKINASDFTEDNEIID